MNRLTGKTETIREWMDLVRGMPEIMEQVTHWHTIPPREAQFADFPPELHPDIRKALNEKGIHQLYRHQEEAFRRVTAGNHIVTVTPTASGKTMCYNLPVLQGLMENDQIRALYLFPTKALAQDQVAELHELVNLMEVDLKNIHTMGTLPQMSVRPYGMQGISW
jgi:DEAD/DEAH box helicase domain-containing protein